MAVGLPLNLNLNLCFDFLGSTYLIFRVKRNVKDFRPKGPTCLKSKTLFSFVLKLGIPLNAILM